MKYNIVLEDVCSFLLHLQLEVTCRVTTSNVDY